MSKLKLLMVCMVAAMGGLLFGYDWVVIGGAKPFYEPYFGLADAAKAWESGFAMSSAVLGCIGGAIGLGWFPDRFGRKPSLLLAAVFFTISALWTAFATGYWSFIAARILGGIGIGLASNVSPVYIAEVSPAELRGRLVSLNQFTIVIGIILAQLVNYIVFQKAVPEISWRVMFGAETVPAALFLVLAFFIPESPRWRVSDQKGAPVVREDRPVAGTSRPLFALLALGVFLAAFQQWCGINVVFNYAEEIFKAAGYDVSGVMFNQVITGIVNCVFTVFAMCLVDKWGRRPLMLLGAGGLAVLYAILGTCYFFEVKGVAVLVVVMAAIACYAMTLAPITWVVLSELFPDRVRGTAMSVAVAALWISCFGLTLTFKPINVAFGAAGTFGLYSAICVAGFLVVARFLRETKGRELE
ncbi:MAG: MFS transporter [Kiritimatiellae bacterium]|nr:MFS transporter [Kiritimatiellia bacterium]